MKNVVEDFVCEVCGEKVIGNGTTDHCPNCLWGKHVDEAVPGDRASKCWGLMKPIAAEYRNEGFRIFYKCEKCNHEFWVKAASAKATAGRWPLYKEDNRELLMELIKNPYSVAE
jgi:hypothetical protein